MLFICTEKSCEISLVRNLALYNYVKYQICSDWLWICCGVVAVSLPESSTELIFHVCVCVCVLSATYIAFILWSIIQLWLHGPAKEQVILLSYSIAQMFITFEASNLPFVRGNTPYLFKINRPNSKLLPKNNYFGLLVGVFSVDVSMQLIKSWLIYSFLIV